MDHSKIIDTFETYHAPADVAEQFGGAGAESNMTLHREVVGASAESNIIVGE